MNRNIFHFPVLVVEDNPTIQMTHRLFLEKLGFKVDVADLGQQALELHDLIFLAKEY